MNKGADDHLRRLMSRLFVAFALIVGGSSALLPRSVASASPVSVSTAYGPTTPACTISLSLTVTSAGTAVTATGNCGVAGDSLTVTIYSTPTVLGTFTAGADGAYAQSLTLPAGLAPGVHTVVVSNGTLSASTTIDIVSPTISSSSGSSGSATSSTSGSGLAFTGADVEGTVAIGAMAVGVGGALVLASRKRRRRNFRM